MHGGSSKIGSYCSLSYTSWSQYLQYQSILIMVRGNKTSEDWWNFIHGLKGNDHYPANFQCICFAPITVNLFLLKCFFPPLRFHMCFSFCLWCSSSLSSLPCNFLIIFIIWFKSQFLRKSLHFQSKVYLFFLIAPCDFSIIAFITPSNYVLICVLSCFIQISCTRL